MRDNKKKDEPEKTPEQEALERHVDAMMDPKLPDPSDEPAEIQPKKPEPTPAPEPAPPAIERLTIRPPKSAKAAKTAKTAPALPSAAPAARKITVSDASAKPLSIDKLDQLAESIVAKDKDKPAEKPDEKPEPKPEPVVAVLDDDDNLPPDNEDDAVQAGDDIPDSDIDDERTDEAVDDIVAHEGDVVLAVADATAAERNREAEMTGKKSHKGLAAFFWFLVAFMAALAIVITVLMMTGGNLGIPKP